MICIVMWTLLKMVQNIRCWRFCIYALCIIVNKTSAMPFVACKFLNRQPMMSFLHISTFVLCAHTVCIAQTVHVAQMHSEQWTLCDHKWLHWFKQRSGKFPDRNQFWTFGQILSSYLTLYAIFKLSFKSTISISGKECFLLQTKVNPLEEMIFVLVLHVVDTEKSFERKTVETRNWPRQRYCLTGL